MKADYNISIGYILKSAEVYRNFSLSGYANEMIVAGFAYQHWGNFDRAKHYLHSGNSQLAETQLLATYRNVLSSNLIDLSTIYERTLAEFFAGIGRPDRAIPFALKYISERDSLFRTQNSYSVSLYENEQKDLKTYKTLQQERMVRNEFIWGFATVLLFASLILFQRNKIKKEKKKTETEKESSGGFTFDLRIGIHTGPIVAGIVGLKKFQYDIWGDTVNLAARMEQCSEAGRINVSESTFKLVKDKFPCSYRGKIEAKNKGEVHMYFVEEPAENRSEIRTRRP